MAQVREHAASERRLVVVELPLSAARSLSPRFLTPGVGGGTDSGRGGAHPAVVGTAARKRVRERRRSFPWTLPRWRSRLPITAGSLGPARRPIASLPPASRRSLLRCHQPVQPARRPWRPGSSGIGKSPFWAHFSLTLYHTKAAASLQFLTSKIVKHRCNEETLEAATEKSEENVRQLYSTRSCT